MDLSLRPILTLNCLVSRLHQLGSLWWRSWDYGSPSVQLPDYTTRGWECSSSSPSQCFHGSRSYPLSKPVSCSTKPSVVGSKSLSFLLETTPTQKCDEHITFTFLGTTVKMWVISNFLGQLRRSMEFFFPPFPIEWLVHNTELSSLIVIYSRLSLVKVFKVIQLINLRNILFVLSRMLTKLEKESHRLWHGILWKVGLALDSTSWDTF